MKKRKGLKLWPTMGAKLDDDGLLQMIRDRRVRTAGLLHSRRANTTITSK